MTAQAEASRQQALLAALAQRDTVPPGLRETGARAERGLMAYRANAQAHAVRALAAVYPTVQAMLGEDDFAQLARELWHTDPPAAGDLGEWGGALPQRLAAIGSLAAWPWLADSARLDLALHRCERAADAAFDAASFEQLRDGDPASLWLRTAAGLAVIVSAHPIAAIHAAHAAAGVARDAAFAAARAALAEGRGESVCVARLGWRGVVHPIEPAEAAFLQAVLGGASLADALAAAGTALDFAATLARALRGTWLTGVATTRYPSDSPKGPPR